MPRGTRRLVPLWRCTGGDGLRLSGPVHALDDAADGEVLSTTSSAARSVPGGDPSMTTPRPPLPGDLVRALVNAWRDALIADVRVAPAGARAPESGPVPGAEPVEPAREPPTPVARPTGTPVGGRRRYTRDRTGGAAPPAPRRRDPARTGRCGPAGAGRGQRSGGGRPADAAADGAARPAPPPMESETTTTTATMTPQGGAAPAPGVVHPSRRPRRP